MKHIVFAAAFALASTAAFADGPSQAVVEPVVTPAEIETETVGSANDAILVPLLLLLAAAVAF